MTERHPTSRLFTVGATFAVSADTADSARERVRNLIGGLSDRVEHAWLDHEAQLFDPSAFEQLPGQLAIDSDEILRTLRDLPAHGPAGDR
jgi:hypothetical protein